MGQGLGRALSLDSETVATLNSILDGSDIASCSVDSTTRVGMTWLNVFSILPEAGTVDEEFPLLIATYPVTRAAVSYTVDGEVRRNFGLAELDHIVKEFVNRTVEDWDMIDPAAESRFLRREERSLDHQWGETTGCHLLEFWQDDGPGHLLDIALWFERLYIFDSHLNPVTIDMLVHWRRRLAAAMSAVAEGGRGWSRSIPLTHPTVSVAEVMRSILG